MEECCGRVLLEASIHAQIPHVVATKEEWEKKMNPITKKRKDLYIFSQEDKKR